MTGMLLPLQVKLSAVSTEDALQLKRLQGDGTVPSTRTRHLPHRTPDKTAQKHNAAADSWV